MRELYGSIKEFANWLQISTLCNGIVLLLCRKIHERTQKGREKVLSTIETQVEFNSKVILSYWCKPWDKTNDERKSEEKEERTSKSGKYICQIHNWWAIHNMWTNALTKRNEIYVYKEDLSVSLACCAGRRFPVMAQIFVRVLYGSQSIAHCVTQSDTRTHTPVASILRPYC